MNFLDKAREALERGWPVFPTSPDKIPYTKHGHKDASLDPDVIAAWAKRWPNANVAVPTGSVTGIAVLDVDGPLGEESLVSLADLRGVRFRPTLEASTGRGRHLYYRTLPGLKSSSSKLGPGLDIRAEGASITIPPSVHKSGRTYQWTNDLPISTFPLAAYLELNPPKPKYVPSTSSVDLGRLVGLLQKAPQGARNATLNRLSYTAGGLVAAGKVTAQDALNQLVEAGVALGLERRECILTVRSGINSGQKAPLL